jgi:hypothetical protein
VQRMVAEANDLDCATIVQRDLDDRSSQGHRSPQLGWQEPANGSDTLAIAQFRYAGHPSPELDMPVMSEHIASWSASWYR